jgi:hypothetical protein
VREVNHHPDSNSQIPAYHNWVAKRKFLDYASGELPDQDLLHLICDENPYSSKYAKESIARIAEIAFKTVEVDGYRLFTRASFGDGMSSGFGGVGSIS